jgi:hypothetical protein
MSKIRSGALAEEDRPNAVCCNSLTERHHVYRPSEDILLGLVLQSRLISLRRRSRPER